MNFYQVRSFGLNLFMSDIFFFPQASRCDLRWADDHAHMQREIDQTTGKFQTLERCAEVMNVR